MTKHLHSLVLDWQDWRCQILADENIADIIIDTFSTQCLEENGSSKEEIYENYLLSYFPTSATRNLR